MSSFRRSKPISSNAFPHTATDGRPSTPVEVILRMLVVKHLYGWSFPQTAHFVSDSLVLRQFCRVYVAPVPDQSTLNRWAKLLQPATLHRLLDHLVHLACQLQVTQGRKLRLDGTVVATNIHHPTDSTLLYDGVRVLSRALGKAKRLLREATTCRQEACDGLDAAGPGQDEAHHGGRPAAGRGGRRAAQNHLSRPARRDHHGGGPCPARAGGGDRPGHRRVASGSRGTLAQFIPLVEQVITQTTRRVLQGEQVPASEKIVSLFEPDTAIIRKGKPGKPTEFGRVLWLDEVEGGIISRYAVLDGNPDEKAQLPPSLDHHRQQFGHPPDAADRGPWAPFRRQRAAMRSEPRASRRWCCPSPARSRPSGSRMSARRGFARGATGAPGSKGGSVA